MVYAYKCLYKINLEEVMRYLMDKIGHAFLYILPVSLILLGSVLMILALLKMEQKGKSSKKNDKKWAMIMSSVIFLSGLLLLLIASSFKDYFIYASQTIAGFFSLMYGIFATLHDFQNKRTQRLTILGVYGILFMIFINLYSAGIELVDQHEKIIREENTKLLDEKKQKEWDTKISGIIHSGDSRAEQILAVKELLQVQISEKSAAIQDKETQFKNQNNQITSLKETLAKTKSHEEELLTEKTDLKEELANKEESMNNLAQKLTQKVDNYNQMLADYNSKFTSQSKLLEDQLKLANQKNSENTESLKGLDKKLENLTLQNNDLKQLNEEQKRQLLTNQQKLDNSFADLSRLLTENKSLKDELQKLKNELYPKIKNLEDLEKSTNDKVANRIAEKIEPTNGP